MRRRASPHLRSSPPSRRGSLRYRRLSYTRARRAQEDDAPTTAPTSASCSCRVLLGVGGASPLRPDMGGGARCCLFVWPRFRACARARVGVRKCEFARIAGCSVTCLHAPRAAPLLMLPLPARNETYAEADYWESRFQTEREYEWFKGKTLHSSRRTAPRTPSQPFCRLRGVSLAGGAAHTRPRGQSSRLGLRNEQAC